MELTLQNSTREGNTFYWDTPQIPYKIQSVCVITSFECFYAVYPLNVTQYLESGRTDTCDTVFNEQFSVYFLEYNPMRTPITDIQDIKIILVIEPL
jgi:hypothetical protein